MGETIVLIVEDDPLVSANLESIVTTIIAAEVVIGASVAEANAALERSIDFAFLDVDVLDGKTYAFALHLHSAGIPFAFVSASNREEVPRELRTVPFVAKPYTPVDIAELLRLSDRLG